MDGFWMAGRAALDDASQLIEEYGELAGTAAARRAELSRDKGNVHHFCHWRQIERMIATLEAQEALGTIH